MRSRPFLVIAGVASLAAVPVAQASRAPTKSERAAIKKDVQRAAGKTARFETIRISSKDKRFAYVKDTEGRGPGAPRAKVTQILIRPGAQYGDTVRQKFPGWVRVVYQDGFAPTTCGDYLERAPVSVLREFKIKDATSGAAC